MVAMLDSKANMSAINLSKVRGSEIQALHKHCLDSKGGKFILQMPPAYFKGVQKLKCGHLIHACSEIATVHLQ